MFGKLFDSLSIRAKVFLSPLILSLFMAGLIAYALVQFGTLEGNLDTIKNTCLRRIVSQEALERRLLVFNTRIMGVVGGILANYDLDNTDKSIQGCAADLAGIQSGLPAELRALCATNSADSGGELLLLFDQYVTWARQVLQEAPADASAAMVHAMTVDAKFKLLENKLGAIEQEQMATAERTYAASLHHLKGMREIFYVLICCSLIICFGIVLFVSNAISRPLRMSAHVVKEIADNRDLTRAIPHCGNDEVGVLAACFNKLLEALRKSIEQIESHAASLAGESKGLAEVSKSFVADADGLVRQSTTVASASEQASANGNNISAAAEQMSCSVRTISVSVEEISVSVKEVAHTCELELHSARTANGQTKKIDELMRRLDESSTQIGGIISIISHIAEQTNLLALNATIESASAGEAGRGFAVVAHEVKELAKQTAQAIGQVSGQITGMQTCIRDAGSAIATTTKTIEEILALSASVSVAVNQQSGALGSMAQSMADASSAAADIARNVTQSARGLTDISGAMQHARATTDNIAQGAQRINASSDELARMAAAMDGLVKQFTI